MINKKILEDKSKFIKVVDSCKTSEHFDCAVIMYKLFCKKWKEESRYDSNILIQASEMLGYIKGQWDAKKTLILKDNA